MFDALLRQGKLPERLVFAPAVHRQFARLWRRSVQSQMEWGVTLFVDKADRVHCRRARAGTTGAFVPDLSVQRSERLLGVYHTHVYPSGETGFAFSDGDFAEFIAHPQMLLLLAQSGGDLFALARTARTVAAVPADFLGGSGQFYGRLADCWEASPHLTFQEALIQTNVVFCRTFGIGFYQGVIHQPLQVVFRP